MEAGLGAAQHGSASGWSGAPGSAARSPLSVDLPQAGSAMCGYRGKRRARSLTGGIDSLLDVRGESVVSLPSLSSGDLQGDGLEGASSPEVWLHTAAVMCASRFVAAGLPSPFTCVVTAVVRHATTYSPVPYWTCAARSAGALRRCGRLWRYSQESEPTLCFAVMLLQGSLA